MSTERIYIVLLVDQNGDETPLLAVRSEALAQEVAAKMGDMGAVVDVPVLDGTDE